MTQHTSQSCANVNPVKTQKNPLPHHAMSNCIKTQNMNPTVLNVNPKNECDCHEMSMRHPMRHIFMSVDHTINGICMQCNILLNEHNSIPQSVFANNNQMRTV